MLRGENPDFYLDEENQRTVRGTRPKVSKRESRDGMSMINMLGSDQMPTLEKLLRTGAAVGEVAAAAGGAAVLARPTLADLVREKEQP